jgi:sirohydrochlorin cobaltochelatase
MAKTLLGQDLSEIGREIGKEMGSALILVGHGSHISPNTGGLVWRHVDYLRLCEVADEVTAAFWKEKPSFAEVLETLTAERLTVVPLFTSRGFFTQSVIPAEMGLTGQLTVRDGREIRYAAPLNEHPYLSKVVRMRVDSVRTMFGLPLDRTAVAVIGHSTRRNPESRRATEAQVARLQGDGLEAWAVYLEDSPAIAEIYELTDAPYLIVVPFFLAAGSHTTIDLPRELGLEPGTAGGVVRGRRVFYTAPVGVEDDLREVILALANDVGARLNPVTSNSGQDPWRGFPAAGREELLTAVKEAGVLQFGGLRLSQHEVRPWNAVVDCEEISGPAALRQRVRERPFRSLATDTNLPAGWRVSIKQPEWLQAVVETVYPGAVAHWVAARSGRLRINSLADTAERQVGMFRPLANLPDEVQKEIMEQVCEGCVSDPLWARVKQPGRLACPEPCNHWLSAALESQKCL